MGAVDVTAGMLGRDARALCRLGGLSGVVLGVGYILIIPLYLAAGAPPRGGEEMLVYLQGKTTIWWAILALSVLTDFLFVPLGFALYEVLKQRNNVAMLMATACIGLFVVLDLAVTWSNYAALIALSSQYAAAINEAERATYAAAASYPSAVLTSTLEGVYSIVTLSLGILIAGLVMREPSFNKVPAYIGVATGVLGMLSVVGALVVSALGTIVILASLLTTLWVMLVGVRLYRLGSLAS